MQKLPVILIILGIALAQGEILARDGIVPPPPVNGTHLPAPDTIGSQAPDLHQNRTETPILQTPFGSVYLRGYHGTFRTVEEPVQAAGTEEAVKVTEAEKAAAAEEAEEEARMLTFFGGGWGGWGGFPGFFGGFGGYPGYFGGFGGYPGYYGGYGYPSYGYGFSSPFFFRALGHKEYGYAPEFVQVSEQTRNK